MKKKNGFTLVELLVTIAIMISILTIAIVSITKISEGIKKQSYESVKSQVITAAEEYLSTNSYYIDTINGGSNVQISVGELVSNDYLNPVTNPITGKRINECSYVEIKQDKKKKSGLSYTFSENDGECPANNFVTVKPGIVIGNLKVEPFGTKLNNNEWYKINESYDEKNSSDVNNENFKSYSQGVVVRLTATVDNSNYYISSIKMSDENELTNWADLYNINTDDRNSDDQNKVIAYDVASYSTTTSNKGKKVTYRAVYSDHNNPESTIEITQTVSYKVDVDPPICNATIIGYKKGDKYICYAPLGATIINIPIKGRCITGSCYCPSVFFQTSDYGSGIKDDLENHLYSGVSLLDRKIYNNHNNINETITDVAGNEGHCIFNESFDIVDPVKNALDKIDNFFDSLELCGEVSGNEGWTKNCRNITQTYVNTSGTTTDTKKASNVCNEGYTTIKSSKGTSCTVKTNIDKTAPKLSNPSVGLSDDERKVTLNEWNNAGKKVIEDQTIIVTKEGNIYKADVCLINVSGSFRIDIKNPSVTDGNGSGVNTKSWKTTGSLTNKNGKSINGCLRTRGDNPCTYTFKKYVSDKVGNQALVATYVFRIGYINNGVSGGTYDSFCN